MSIFPHFDHEASEIEREIERKGIALRIDWGDDTAVAALAREALDYQPTAVRVGDHDPEWYARVELYGLANLMLKVMAESAQMTIHTHGGVAWKAFGRALWREWQARQVRTGTISPE